MECDLDVMESQYPDMPTMQTEHKCGNFYWENDFNPEVAPNDHAYGEVSSSHLDFRCQQSGISVSTGTSIM